MCGDVQVNKPLHLHVYSKLKNGCLRNGGWLSKLQPPNTHLEMRVGTSVSYWSATGTLKDVQFYTPNLFTNLHKKKAAAKH